MLTARFEEIERIVGLELGADDYVPKPFSVRELVARVRAVLRRTEAPPAEEPAPSLQAGGISVNLARRSVTVEAKEVHLPLKQLELLKVLIANKGTVLSREELFHQVWDAESHYDSGALDVHVHWLREKIETDPANPRYILTLRGIGYKFADDCEK